MVPPPTRGPSEKPDLSAPWLIDRIAYRSGPPPRPRPGCHISSMVVMGVILIVLMCAILAFWTGRMPSLRPTPAPTGSSNVVPLPSRVGTPPTPVPVIPTERLSGIRPYASPTPTPPPLKHRVQSGDTLAAIAQKYGISVQLLMSANGLKSNVVRPGDELIIPLATATPTPR